MASYVVLVKRGVDFETTARVIERLGAKITQKLFTVFTLIIEADQGIVESISMMPCIVSVEPNGIMRALQ